MRNVNLSTLAKQQRTLTYAFLAILLGQLTLAFTPFAMLLPIAFAILPFLVFRIMRVLNMNPAYTFLTCVAMLLPIINLVALWLVNQAACAALRRGGLRVGAIGVHPDDLSKIGDITGHCTNCWYDLTGNESGYCPECGRRI